MSVSVQLSTALSGVDRPRSPVGSHFVSTYPPFSTWSDAWLGEVDTILEEPRPATGLGLYVHIPFCVEKCDYCYYLSFASRDTRDVRSYVDAVLREATFYAARPALRDRPLDFVYFGGGTPSLLEPREIVRLASGLVELFPRADDCEFTFECSPRTVRAETVEAMQAVGVTRPSMGVQSFDDEILSAHGRVHRVRDILAARELLLGGNFDWINLDLMAGLPGETAKQWRTSVKQCVKLRPESITVYQTEMPYNTKTYRDWAHGQLVDEPPPWEIKRQRQEQAFRSLERAGYHVVNAYAAVLDPRRHRFRYQEVLWGGGDMLGLGLSSYSYVNGVHFQNLTSLRRYRDSVSEGRPPRSRALRLSREERLVRELILALKQGVVHLKDFERRLGENIVARFDAQLEALAERGWGRVTDRHIELTRTGLSRVDAIAPLFYLPEHRDIRYS